MNDGKDVRSVPKALVDEMVASLERESSVDWTREFDASGGSKTSTTRAEEIPAEKE